MVISLEILKFPWWPSRAYSSSKSSETALCVPRRLFHVSLTWGNIKLQASNVLLPVNEEKMLRSHRNLGNMFRNNYWEFKGPKPQIFDL